MPQPSSAIVKVFADAPKRQVIFRIPRRYYYLYVLAALNNTPSSKRRVSARRRQASISRHLLHWSFSNAVGIVERKVHLL